MDEGREEGDQEHFFLLKAVSSLGLMKLCMNSFSCGAFCELFQDSVHRTSTAATLMVLMLCSFPVTGFFTFGFGSLETDPTELSCRPIFHQKDLLGNI